MRAGCHSIDDICSQGYKRSRLEANGVTVMENRNAWTRLIMVFGQFVVIPDFYFTWVCQKCQLYRCLWHASSRLQCTCGIVNILCWPALMDERRCWVGSTRCPWRFYTSARIDV